MTDFDQFERRLAAALRSDADQSVDPFEAGRIARAAIAGTRPARRFGRGRGMTLLAAAALLLVGGALAAGSSFVRLPSVIPPVPAPSVVAVATASPDATSPSPSILASPTPVHSVTPTPITWTTSSLTEDWPAPVRTEPPGPPIVVPTFLKIVYQGCPGSECGVETDWGDPLVDPIGDAGSADNPWADIKEVTFCGPACLTVRRVSSPPPAVDPRQLWIAYGVVVDTDGDGLPDWRYGIDNVPLDKTASFPESDRSWRTDLHTGRTDYAVGDHVALRDGGPGPVFYPWDPDSFKFGAETAGDGMVGGLPKRFYAWASVIEDGRVVATDYAPDAGWLVPSPNAKP